MYTLKRKYLSIKGQFLFHARFVLVELTVQWLDDKVAIRVIVQLLFCCQFILFYFKLFYFIRENEGINNLP